MPEFWIDSDVLISAKNGLLAFDIAPRFWVSLDAHVQAGQISSPSKVYDELTTEFHEDELATWARERKETHFVEPDDAVQSSFRIVADHVLANYAQAFTHPFLDGADPWLVAYAMTRGGRVVTLETLANLPNPDRRTGLINSKVKIPNICNEFGVQLATLPQMLRELGVNDL